MLAVTTSTMLFTINALFLPSELPIKIHFEVAGMGPNEELVLSPAMSNIPIHISVLLGLVCSPSSGEGEAPMRRGMSAAFQNSLDCSDPFDGFRAVVNILS